MPTALPTRRPTLGLVLRRHAPERATVRNLLVTVYECAMAAGLVLSLVLIFSHFETSHVTDPSVRPAMTQTFGP